MDCGGGEGRGAFSGWFSVIMLGWQSCQQTAFVIQLTVWCAAAAVSRSPQSPAHCDQGIKPATDVSLCSLLGLSYIVRRDSGQMD